MSKAARYYVLLSLFFVLFVSPINSQRQQQQQQQRQLESLICPFQSIYQFGDSIADTGNLILIGPDGASSKAARFPYGETYFHRPTGRFSNGQLIIDFLARALQLPLLNPYLAKGQSFKNGVNFAVAGSTALDSSFFTDRNISSPSTNTPLSHQLEWFRSHLSSICSNQSDCSEQMRKSLIMMGEIGGNDYNYAFFQGKNIEEIRNYIPPVVAAISDAVREVIRHGAVRMVVPGNFPVGCLPVYLTSFQTNGSSAYDDRGCLKQLNEFAMEHNNQLQAAITSLRQEFPQAFIMYGDYYTAYQSVLRNASALGFDEKMALRSCCGTGGAYNYDKNRECGAKGVPVCQNPDRYISWDGVHLTQTAYMEMSEFLIDDILSQI